ncbi:hypothetical protein OOT33_09585 [Sphingobium sp. DEHP117]|uniref:flagellar basal body rod C-terminal domain-containing protein n=1 Tax=Sphingobium sp. DEHP117 TaxID=2993436 RepID=UPI0027D5345F|nr:flagellar basal body rod C-terminal domain-containing protein [Sphingobium sp. DEHP117]MDQ4420681.1 hypothetical protein [Sphingobium sp. DEHP117]
MQAIGISLSGIQSSLARFDASAARVANASVNPSAPDPALSNSPRQNVDIASEMIEQLTAKLTYDANLSVLKSADEMQQSLIRRWA